MFILIICGPVTNLAKYHVPKKGFGFGARGFGASCHSA